MRYMEDLFLTMFPNIRRIEEKYEKNSRINNNISFLCMDVVWMYSYILIRLSEKRYKGYKII